MNWIFGILIVLLIVGVVYLYTIIDALTNTATKINNDLNKANTAANGNFNTLHNASNKFIRDLRATNMKVARLETGVKRMNNENKGRSEI